MTPREAYRLINQLADCRWHFDTITAKFTQLTTELFKEDGIFYTIHDLRRCFVTNSLRAGHPHERVRIAAGYKRIATTLDHYARDSRGLTKKRYVPQDESA